MNNYIFCEDMKKVFKNFFILFFLGIFLSIPFFVTAEKNPTNIYFFYSETCPHCHKEAIFLSKLKNELKDKIKIYSFEVSKNRANGDLFEKFAQKFKISSGGVPVVFVGNKYMIGYGEDTISGEVIRRLVDNCLVNYCQDMGHAILFPDEENCVHGLSMTKQEEQECQEVENSKVVSFPLVGRIDLEKTTLFGATFVLGFLDGFNPCAMWVLIFLISLLLNIDSSKRRWILGITFIIGSSLVYFLFMVAWLKMFLFVGYLLIVRIIIGGLAIVFGVYNLKKYFKNKAGVCQVTNTESRQKILKKLKDSALQKNLLLAMLGIVVLAFAVNLIELACSAGFPAIYTKMLSMHSMTGLGHYMYILLYIFFFMIDDIIVFVIAMVTLRLAGVDGKYSKYSNLIGGIIILILGLIMIINPDLLMFG